MKTAVILAVLAGDSKDGLANETALETIRVKLAPVMEQLRADGYPAVLELTPTRTDAVINSDYCVDPERLVGSVELLVHEGYEQLRAIERTRDADELQRRVLRLALLCSRMGVVALTIDASSFRQKIDAMWDERDPEDASILALTRADYSCLSGWFNLVRMIQIAVYRYIGGPSNGR